MKKIILKTSALWLPIVLMVMSCARDFDTINVESLPVNNDQQAVLHGLAQIEKKIVTDYAAATLNLYEGVTNFKASTSDTNLAQVQSLWKLARDPWESNESFAFGPVVNDGIDGNTDDWPFDRIAFDAILSSSQTLDQAYASQMTTSTKGFHAIEYLIFGADGTKTANGFSQRELQMLDLLTADLTGQANHLVLRWTPGTSDSFYDAFVSAGAGSLLYPTTQSALGDVLGSMVDITNELPNNKIQIPLLLQSSVYLESWFSDYSYYDYLNNIKGVYSVYLGQYGSTTAQKNLSSLVAGANPSVNEKVVTQFKLCLALLELIQPTSMNQAILTRQNQLKELITELQKLNRFLDEDVRQVLDL